MHYGIKIRMHISYLTRVGLKIDSDKRALVTVEEMRETKHAGVSAFQPYLTAIEMAMSAYRVAESA